MKSKHRNIFKPIKTQDHIESEKQPSTKAPMSKSRNEDLQNIAIYKSFGSHPSVSLVMSQLIQISK